MSRETTSIKLSNGDEVKVIAKLTWGEHEAIQNELLSGAKISGSGAEQKIDFDPTVLSKVKYFAMSKCITEIVSNGVAKPFSKEWIDGLDVEDGTMVHEAVDVLSKKKQK